jgi:8-amino-7-oxononanoate synthase
MIRFGKATPSTITVDDQRIVPNAHTRDVIYGVVLNELSRVMPSSNQTLLTPESVLTDEGIDDARLEDAIVRLQGSYGMRLHKEWILDIQTCDDLVTCIATRMFDTQDTDAAEALLKDSSHRENPTAARTYSFEECEVLRKRVADLQALGLDNPFLLAHESVTGKHASICGKDVISFTSFDYLGLTSHPAVTSAAKTAIDQFGCGATASRMVGGNTTLLNALDNAIADFIGTERATVFPCGFGTNASVFGHLFNAQDLILYDELAHKSITEGAMTSQAASRSFRHNDFEQLDGLLRDIRHKYRRTVVAIEGVYSMDGDYPDLPKFIEVKQRHDALLYIDEAHSLGTMGNNGRGIAEFFEIDPKSVDIWMGTISKSLGSGGGYLAGSRELIDYLGLTTPAFVFSTACSPPNTAAALAALQTLQAEPWRVRQLHERSALFLSLAKEAGLDTGPSLNTPVIPVIVGSSQKALAVSQRLLEMGINARPILFPAVRESAARIRFFITCEHTDADIHQAVQAVTEAVATS